MGTFLASPFSASLLGFYHPFNSGADVFSTVVVMMDGVLLGAV